MLVSSIRPSIKYEFIIDVVMMYIRWTSPNKAVRDEPFPPPTPLFISDFLVYKFLIETRLSQEYNFRIID